MPYVPDDDRLMVSTLKCTSCGRKWLLTEDVDGRDEGESPSKRTPEGRIVCSNCGAMSVWEAGIEKIERRQG
jgi:hypothetical protein